MNIALRAALALIDPVVVGANDNDPLGRVRSYATGTNDNDPLGRVRAYATGAATALFLYDGDRLVEEYTGVGVLLRRYAHGPGVDEPLIWYEGSTTTDPRWLIADRQGSIVATTNAAGAATTYGYGPYGEPHAWTGPGGAMLSRFRTAAPVPRAKPRAERDQS